MSNHYDKHDRVCDEEDCADCNPTCECGEPVEARGDLCHECQDALNAHDDLVEALEAMVWILDLEELPKGEGIKKAFTNAKAILAKAKGENNI